MWLAMTTPTTPPTLRSRNWFAPKNLDGFMHRAYLKAEGFSDAVFDGRPVIGICNSWSELNNCNAHLRQVAEAVKRGVWSAGGFPLEFPVISLGEILMKPTTMLFRNLMAMDVEECIRAYPLDSVVLLAACDKTTPAMLMGAASADVPAIMVTGGPMLRGMWCDQELGSGTDARKIWAQRRAGEITDEVMAEVESCLSRSSGHCMVMGTASTMAAMAETLGLALPGNAAIPAPDSRRLALAEMSGRRAVEMALARGPKPSEILTAAAFDNAIRADMALGGSTNAIVHLVALAGRAGVPLPLRRFDELSRTTPLLANVRPSGKHLMEDFYYAGGVPAVLRELLPLLDGDALTVNGKTLGENVARRALPRLRHHPAALAAAPARGRHRDPRPATSARAARSSSSRPPPRISWSTAAARWCSRTISISSGASTTRRCPSTRTPCWCSSRPGRRAAPACPSGAPRRCRRACSRRA